MSKDRYPDEGYQGDRFEAAREAGWWSRTTDRAGKAGGAGLGVAGAAELAAGGRPELGIAGILGGAAVYGVAKAASMLSANEQDDHIRAEHDKIDEDSRRFFGDL